MSDDERTIIEMIKSDTYSSPKDIAIALDLDISVAHSVVVGLLRRGVLEYKSQDDVRWLSIVQKQVNGDT